MAALPGGTLTLLVMNNTKAFMDCGDKVLPPEQSGYCNFVDSDPLLHFIHMQKEGTLTTNETIPADVMTFLNSLGETPFTPIAPTPVPLPEYIGRDEFTNFENSVNQSITTLQSKAGTTVAASTTNGNILVNDLETTVYDDTALRGEVGVLTDLETTSKGSLVQAINEIKIEIPTITAGSTNGHISVSGTDLKVYDDSSLQTKVNELSTVTQGTTNGHINVNGTDMIVYDDSVIKEEIGTLSSLTTNAKSDLVSALNELKADDTTVAAGTSNGGLLINGTETVVYDDSAIKGEIGTLTDLQTTSKSDLVSAINEVKSGTSTLAAMSDVDVKTSAPVNGDILGYENGKWIPMAMPTTLYVNAEPTTGSFSYGQDLKNSAPTPGGYMGWVCTTGGTANNTPWAANVDHTTNDLIFSGSDVYQATVSGRTTSTIPVFPTTASATVEDKAGTTIWASKAYVVGDEVVPATDNGYWYECTTAGTSGTTEVDTLTVSSAPSTAGNVVVTLNGVASNVAVTAGTAEVDSLSISSGPSTAGNVVVTLNGIANNVAVQAGTREVDTLTVNAAPSTAGNTVVTLNGVATNVAVQSGVNEVDTLTVSNGATTSGNVVVTLNGVATNVAVQAGTEEVDTLTVSTGATTAGNITITLNGVATTVAVAAADTAGAVGDKIRATTFTGWTTGGTAGSATVTFTANAVGVQATPTFTDTDTTGTAASFVVTTPGVNADAAADVATKIRGTSFTGWTTGGTGTTVTFTANAVGTQTTPTYADGGTGATGTISATTAGVNGDTANDVANKIRSTSYPNWITGGTGTTITFTATAAGTRTTPTYADGGTGAAASFVVTTPGVNADAAADVATKIRGTSFTGWTTGGTGTTVTFTANAVGIQTPPNYNDGGTFAAGTITVTTAGVNADAATDVATKIRGTSFTGWTTGGTGTTVTFTANVAGTQTTPAYADGGTGAAGSMAVTTLGGQAPTWSTTSGATVNDGTVVWTTRPIITWKNIDTKAVFKTYGPISI